MFAYIRLYPRIQVNSCIHSEENPKFIIFYIFADIFVDMGEYFANLGLVYRKMLYFNIREYSRIYSDSFEWSFSFLKDIRICSNITTTTHQNIRIRSRVGPKFSYSLKSFFFLFFSNIRNRDFCFFIDIQIRSIAKKSHSWQH